MATVLGNALEFLHDLGVYEVVLPFLLIFTMVFALLEKTKVLGTEKVGNDTLTRKNLNAMVAFVVGFMSIASARLVEAITTISSHVVVLLLLVVCFLMLIGSFYKTEEWEKNDLGKYVKWPAIIIIFLSIVFIALNAIQTEDGDTWLEVVWDWFTSADTSPAVAAVLLIIGVVIFMYWISYSDQASK